MKLFIDTEFTQFFNPQLLSIGIVDERGNSFYGELHHEGPLNEFVTEHVYSQWGKVPFSLHLDGNSLSRHLNEWLLRLNAPIELCYDYHTDADFFDLVSSIKPIAYTHLGYLCGPEYEQAGLLEWDRIEKEMGLRRHHALADAYALRATYWAAHGRPELSC